METEVQKETSHTTAASYPVTYDAFRTGYTYHEVYHMIYGRKWKRRHGVLGFWRELKQRLYAQYINEYQND